VAERVQLTLASYEGGRADLASVLSARRDAAEARFRSLDLEAQLMGQRARLAYLIAE
jgi:cobalt-zinc-cadmium efflux system outer membrane protein